MIPVVHQTACTIVAGLLVASSPDFLQKSAAQRREADLTRQIAHQQSNLAFGAGRACTKAFQRKNFPKDVIPDGEAESQTLCRKVAEVPARSSRCGGDDIVGVGRA